MPEKMYNILFICYDNSARSIMCEAIMNHLGHQHFKAFSAGSNPSSAVDPMAIEVLSAEAYHVGDLRTKSWSAFSTPDAPEMDFIITVCDSAAGEVCPIWPGHPLTAHWGFADPAKVEGDHEHKHKAFVHTKMEIASRIRLFLDLPMNKIERMSLQHHLHEIGKA